jgi:hypothetical protein
VAETVPLFLAKKPVVIPRGYSRFGMKVSMARTERNSRRYSSRELFFTSSLNTIASAISFIVLRFCRL